MEPLKRYFSGLPEKDQKALKLLVLFCGPLLLYFLILKPSFNYYHASKANYQDSRELLTWMEQNKSNVSTIKTTHDMTTSLPLSQFISTTAENKNLTISRLQPQGEQGVRIWLNDVSFSILLDFLISLTEKGFSLSSITIDKTSTTGIVNAQCLIMEG